jgi:hypothetical protein
VRLPNQLTQEFQLSLFFSKSQEFVTWEAWKEALKPGDQRPEELRLLHRSRPLLTLIESYQPSNAAPKYTVRAVLL